MILKALRKEKGLSQKHFASIIGVAQNTLCNWENGKRQPDYEMVLKIADYFGVTVDYLLGRDEKPTNRVKELRKMNNISQEKLASLLNVHQTAISQWETGRTTPDIETAISMAKLFNVSLDYLLGGREEHMNNIRKYRLQAGMKQIELCNILGISQGALSGWENGRYEPDIKSLNKMAELFNITVDDLLGREVSFPDQEKSPRKKGVRIPVYGDTAAGVPILAIEDYDSDDPDDWEEITEEMARGGDYIALRIRGNSMEPRMKTGDIVIVRLQPDVETGDVAIVRVNGDSATCKKIKKTPEGLWLIPFNPEYEPMFYSPRDIAELPVTVIGKVVELRAKF